MRSMKRFVDVCGELRCRDCCDCWFVLRCLSNAKEGTGLDWYCCD